MNIFKILSKDQKIDFPSIFASETILVRALWTIAQSRYIDTQSVSVRSVESFVITVRAIKETLFDSRHLFSWSRGNQHCTYIHTYICIREIQELVEAFTREASISRRLGIVSRVALAAFLYPSCAASRVSRDQADSSVGFATTWRMLICSIPREKCSQIERERKRASQRLFRRVNFKNVIPILLSCFILYYINRRERNMFKIFKDFVQST